MSVSVEIKGTEEERKKIFEEIASYLKEKYGEKVGRIQYYPSGLYELADLALKGVQIILVFTDENDPEYPLLKGFEAGLKKYIELSKERR